MLITLGSEPATKPSFTSILIVSSCAQKDGVLTFKGRRQFRAMLEHFRNQSAPTADRMIARLAVGDLRPVGIEVALQSFANQFPLGCVAVDANGSPEVVKEWQEFAKLFHSGVPKDTLAHLREATRGLSDELISELAAEQ